MIPSATSIENLIILLIGASMLSVSVSMRLETYVKALRFQGFLLFALVAARIGNMDWAAFALLVVETLVLKAIVIPRVLAKVMKRHGFRREVEPSIPNYYSVVISALILITGLYIAYRSSPYLDAAKPLLFGISFSIMINGLFLTVTRRKIITQVMGYMLLENGIFLFSLSVAREMPLVVSMGVLLDIFVGVFLLGFFVNKISLAFDEAESDALTGLKD